MVFKVRIVCLRIPSGDFELKVRNVASKLDYVVIETADLLPKSSKSPDLRRRSLTIAWAGLESLVEMYMNRSGSLPSRSG